VLHIYIYIYIYDISRLRVKTSAYYFFTRNAGRAAMCPPLSYKY